MAQAGMKRKKLCVNLTGRGMRIRDGRCRIKPKVFPSKRLTSINDGRASSRQNRRRSSRQECSRWMP
jgi:hypothetical protein